MNKTEFLISDFKANCVDDFLRFCVTPKYSDFSHVCKFIFTLSHGQSAVECGFNINNNNHNANIQTDDRRQILLKINILYFKNNTVQLFNKTLLSLIQIFLFPIFG